MAHSKLKAITICVESQTAFKTIFNPYYNSIMVQETEGATSRLKIDLRLYWVKAHVWTMGNEAANEAVKMAKEQDTEKDERLSKSYEKYRLKQKLLKLWQKNWDDSKIIGRHAYNLVPQVSTKILWNNHFLTAYIKNHFQTILENTKSKTSLRVAHPVGTYIKKISSSVCCSDKVYLKIRKKGAILRLRIMEVVKKYLNHPRVRKAVIKLGEIQRKKIYA